MAAQPVLGLLQRLPAECQHCCECLWWPSELVIELRTNSEPMAEIASSNPCSQGHAARLVLPKIKLDNPDETIGGT